MGSVNTDNMQLRHLIIRNRNLETELYKLKDEKLDKMRSFHELIKGINERIKNIEREKQELGVQINHLFNSGERDLGSLVYLD